MPKVFLIVPPEMNFIESYVSQKVDKGREFRQKLGLLSVAGYLRDVGGITPRIVDSLADGLDLDDLTAILEEEQPDLVGFSVLTFNILDCLAVVERLKKVCPRTKVCFGGFHVSLYPTETLALPNVDFIVFGDGEVTFTELVHALAAPASRQSEKLASVKGLGWEDRDGRAVLNTARPMLGRDEYDALPMPAHDLLDIGKYTVVLADESRVASIQTSRGCPSRCTFCDIRMTPFMYRSNENVLREIHHLQDMGIKEFFIIDDTFTINRKRTISICNELTKANLGIKYKISSRVDKVDPEVLDALAESGCYRIHYGVETGTQRLLDYLEKGITPEQVSSAFEMTKRAGIESFAYMMIGIPTETRDEIEESIRYVDRLQPYHVNYSICTPFPKTKLYETALQANPKMEDYWAGFAVSPDPKFKIRTMNEHLTTAELRELQDKALRKFYTSPKRIVREIYRTKSLKQLMVKAKFGARLIVPRSSYSGTG